MDARILLIVVAAVGLTAALAGCTFFAGGDADKGNETRPTTVEGGAKGAPGFEGLLALAALGAPALLVVARRRKP
jgi:hypothetical protein